MENAMISRITSLFDKTLSAATLGFAHSRSIELKTGLKQAQEEQDKGAQLIKFSDLYDRTIAITRELDEQHMTETRRARFWARSLTLLGTGAGIALGVLAGIGVAPLLALPATISVVTGAIGGVALAFAASGVAWEVVRSAELRFENGNKELAQALATPTVQSIINLRNLQRENPKVFAASKVADEVFTRFPELKARFDAEADRNRKEARGTTKAGLDNSYRPAMAN